MTDEALVAIYRAKRALHPELRGGVTWNGIRRVLVREDIGLFVTPLPQQAQAIHYAGAWSILIDSRLPARRHTMWCAHELAHIWAHHDSRCARHERVYNYTECTDAHDPREAEADFLATLVLGGARMLRLYRLASGER